MDYERERYDLVNVLKKVYNSNDKILVGSFKSVIDSYLEYIEATIQHVVSEIDLREYSLDTDTRINTEMYSEQRRRAHNNAIQKTMSFHEMLLLGETTLFCQGCIGKKTVKDFSPTERRKVGDFIFSTISTCSTLTEKEIEKIGSPIETIFEETTKKKESLERGYKVEITPDSEDIFNSLI